MAQVTNQTMVKFINIIPTTKEQLDNYASIEESAFAKGPLFFKHESREKGEARNSKLTEQEITSFPHMYLYKTTQLKVEM